MVHVAVFACAAALAIASADETTCSVTLVHPATLSLQAGSTEPIDATHFVDASTGATVSCNTDERVEIQSANVIEASGFLVDISVAYSKSSTESYDVDSTSSACYQSNALAADETNYPGYDIPALTLTCPASVTSDCSIQYDVDATCVAITLAATPASAPATTPAPVTTPAPTSETPVPTSETPTPTLNVTTMQTDLVSQATTTTTGYYTRAIILFISIVAGRAMMYASH